MKNVRSYRSNIRHQIEKNYFNQWNWRSSNTCGSLHSIGISIALRKMLSRLSSTIACLISAANTGAAAAAAGWMEISHPSSSIRFVF